MDPNQKGHQNQDSDCQETARKNLLRSDELYQVINWLFLYAIKNLIKYFFSTCTCSIYLKLVYIQESLNAWRSPASLRPSTLCKILSFYNFFFQINLCFLINFLKWCGKRASAISLLLVSWILISDLFSASFDSYIMHLTIFLLNYISVLYMWVSVSLRKRFEASMC